MMRIFNDTHLPRRCAKFRFENDYYKEAYKVSRNPKVCKVCLGNANATQHKCIGVFGSDNCNDWLWGWFVVDDAVSNASKRSLEAQSSTSTNNERDAIVLIKELIQKIVDIDPDYSCSISDCPCPVCKAKLFIARTGKRKRGKKI